MSSTTAPRSPSITGENIAPKPRIVTINLGSLRHNLDAHEIPDRDFNVVTRPYQDNDTQRWLLTNVGGDVYTMRLIQDSAIDLVRPILGCNDQPSIKIAE